MPLVNDMRRERVEDAWKKYQHSMQQIRARRQEVVSKEMASHAAKKLKRVKESLGLQSP